MYYINTIALDNSRCYGCNSHFLAVIKGLRSGKLRGVALDVYEHEESLFFQDLSALNYEERISHWDLEFSQLISFPNVIVTPHQVCQCY